MSKKVSKESENEAVKLICPKGNFKSFYVMSATIKKVSGPGKHVCLALGFILVFMIET